ncbi:MAG: hypothetical protein Q9227_005195 [Pyrenula ochraceoflavens]
MGKTAEVTQPSEPADVADYTLTTPIASTGLRSHLTSYGDQHFSLFLRKAFIKALGYSSSALSRPIVGIINTYSAFNPCHGNVPQLIEAVKRGVLLEGALPIEFPTISLHESFASPTSMLYRNLMSMDTEEMIKAQPVDAVVGIGGCDKTLPAQLMGAISANKPFISLCTGPMQPGTHPANGARVGACTDCRSNWAAYRASALDIEDIAALNDELAPSVGTCGVMGTASTMACLVATLGLMPLHGGTPSAVSSARIRVAEETGTIGAGLAKASTSNNGSSPRTPQSILTHDSFHNAIVVLQALGGSTNAIIHLLAIANRHPSVRGQITLNEIDTIGRSVPLLVDLKPSGDNYMTDFHAAGGLPLLLHRLRPLLKLNAPTVTGQMLGEVLDSYHIPKFHEKQQIIRSLERPLYPSSSLVVLTGSLAHRGAVLKASASPNIKSHRGPACVFNGTADMAARIDSAELDVTENSVLILRGIGPVSNPGMPEAGLIPIPRELARTGVKDMLRISDGRISGTASGCVVVGVVPEAGYGIEREGGSGVGGLSVVRDGDMIHLDVVERRLDLEIDEVEFKRRVAELQEREQRERMKDRNRRSGRGYRGLYESHVNQADEGCDLGFLVADTEAS